MSVLKPFESPRYYMIPEPEDVLDRTSEYYLRATRAGWVFGRAHTVETGTMRTVVNGSFVCVCGREERYSISFGFDEMKYMRGPVLMRQDKYDVALMLHTGGSFSREHLLEDGYSPEQVEAMLEKFWVPYPKLMSTFDQSNLYGNLYANKGTYGI